MNTLLETLNRALGGNPAATFIDAYVKTDRDETYKKKYLKDQILPNLLRVPGISHRNAASLIKVIYKDEESIIEFLKKDEFFLNNYYDYMFSIKYVWQNDRVQICHTSKSFDDVAPSFKTNNEAKYAYLINPDVLIAAAYIFDKSSEYSEIRSTMVDVVTRNNTSMVTLTSYYRDGRRKLLSEIKIQFIDNQIRVYNDYRGFMKFALNVLNFESNHRVEQVETEDEISELSSDYKRQIIDDLESKMNVLILEREERSLRIEELNEKNEVDAGSIERLSTKIKYLNEKV